MLSTRVLTFGYGWGASRLKTQSVQSANLKVQGSKLNISRTAAAPRPSLLYNPLVGESEDYIRHRDLLDLEMSPRLREARKAMQVFRERMRELDIQYVVKVCDEDAAESPSKTTLNVLIDSSTMTLSTAMVFLKQERDWLEQKLVEKFGAEDSDEDDGA